MPQNKAYKGSLSQSTSTESEYFDLDLSKLNEWWAVILHQCSSCEISSKDNQHANGDATDRALLIKELRYFREFLAKEYGHDLNEAFEELSGGKVQLSKARFIGNCRLAGYDGNADLVFATLDISGSGKISAKEFRALQVVSNHTMKASHDGTQRRESLDSIKEEYSHQVVLQPGAKVEVHSLQNAKELNGLQGKVLWFNSDTGRWRCSISTGATDVTKDLKPGNLHVLENESEDERSSEYWEESHRSSPRIEALNEGNAAESGRSSSPKLGSRRARLGELDGISGDEFRTAPAAYHNSHSHLHAKEPLSTKNSSPVAARRVSWHGPSTKNSSPVATRRVSWHGPHDHTNSDARAFNGKRASLTLAELERDVMSEQKFHTAPAEYHNSRSHFHVKEPLSTKSASPVATGRETWHDSTGSTHMNARRASLTLAELERDVRSEQKFHTAPAEYHNSRGHFHGKEPLSTENARAVNGRRESLTLAQLELGQSVFGG